MHCCNLSVMLLWGVLGGALLLVWMRRGFLTSLFSCRCWAMQHGMYKTRWTVKFRCVLGRSWLRCFKKSSSFVPAERTVQETRRIQNKAPSGCKPEGACNVICFDLFVSVRRRRCLQRPLQVLLVLVSDGARAVVPQQRFSHLIQAGHPGAEPNLQNGRPIRLLWFYG